LRYHWSEWKGLDEPRSKQVQYGIKQGYRHRLDNAFYDDTPNKDEFQRQVYETAAALAKEIGASQVADVGCGSGFKLIKNFPDTPTIGFDLEPTVSFLRGSYPERRWEICNFNDNVKPVDLVICSDVIEHIPDPDSLMNFLAKMVRKRLVLSTPERRMVYGWSHSGPPANPAHCREWTTKELRSYASRWFVVERTEISSREQATQVLICSAKV
jgi:2-polyprenyl-3-methyl-5-hydroxy-6-metoxy-1,4-benzoquinol methylase